ncbi:MAG TPA: polyhydroxyalkanoate depolymerase [Candidatus Limnocylindrales bacterium]|nr:polyhydroxyalkanoate depolymerase [Candidatus Limnocylindrales bacterium]
MSTQSIEQSTTSIEGATNPLLYQLHEVGRTALSTAVGINVQFLKAATDPLLRTAEVMGIESPALDRTRRIVSATERMAERAIRQYDKPSYDIDSVEIAGQDVAVKEVVVNDRPFGSLLHFERETDRKDPPVLVVAPMSGHYSTLLSDTVRQLLPNQDVYITDWKNARDVPLEAGRFGLDGYVDDVTDYIRELGPETNVVAVCQSTVPVLAAISRLAETEPESQPLTMTLMAGPLDTTAAPSEVTKFAERTPLSLIQQSWITKVPQKYAGRGRLVYPGFIQLSNFMAMDPRRHQDAEVKLYQKLVDADVDPTSRADADKIEKFYNEFYATSDSDAQFYLDTVKGAFQDHELPNGTMTHRGEPVRPKAITRTSVLTVEGAKDHISSPGQTVAVHDWLEGLDDSQKYHYLQEGAGHYGVFSGRHWKNEISPRIGAFIREAAQNEGYEYDEPAISLIAPEQYS